MVSSLLVDHETLRRAAAAPAWHRDKRPFGRTRWGLLRPPHLPWPGSTDPPRVPL